MTSASWIERLLWLAMGVALAAGAYLALDPGSKSEDVEPPAGSGEVGLDTDSTPQPGDGAEGLECYLGVVLARQTVDVAPEGDGLLDAISVGVGDRVQQGQLIARLDTEALGYQLGAEQANLEKVTAQIHGADIIASRLKKMMETRTDSGDGLFSNEEIENARSDYAKAKADLQAARAEAKRVEATIRQLETALERAEIRAPFDGTVAQRYLDLGARSNPALPVVRLISAENLLTRFAVSPEERSRVPIGKRMFVEVEPLGHGYPATVERLAPEIDEAAQMVFVEARVEVGTETAGEISSGARARVSLARDGEQRSCLAP